MRIDFLSDKNNWKNACIRAFVIHLRAQGHQVRWVHSVDRLASGELLFVLGFFQILPKKALQKHRRNLILHESALPAGRGWSPLSWQILQGRHAIPLTLFEAVEKVDAGPIYARGTVRFKGNELLPEIRREIGAEMIRLCRAFILNYPASAARPKAQSGRSSYFRQRTPKDSRLNPSRSIASQFNILRIADNDMYPPFFSYRGADYALKISKINK